MRERQPTQTEPPENNENNPQDLIPQLEESKNKIQELEKQNRGLYAQVCNLKTGFRSKFLTGRRRMVTYLYGKEIAAYMHIQYVSLQRAKEDNKGKSSYPFLYKTNALLLANQFGITPEAATKTINFLIEIGAWRLVKTETTPAKIYTYQLGERKRNFYTSNGKRAFTYVNSFYFNLSKNSKSLNFYKEEIERLMGIHSVRQSKIKTRQDKKIRIAKLIIDVQKKLKSLYGKQADKEWKEISKWYIGKDDASRLKELQDTFEGLKDEIQERNREKFNPYNGTKAPPDAYKRRSGKYKRLKIET